MDYRIQKAKLKGNIKIPTSKSYSHRHLIMAMLSQNKTIIQHVNMCDDIEATLNVGRSLGVNVEVINDEVSLDSSTLWNENCGLMDVYASGSTLRFFIPICLTHKGTYAFFMRDRLKNRSLKVYEDIFKTCTFKKNENILEISGQIEAGYYEIDGSHSSQFASGLLMALPLLDGDSELVIKEPFVSQDYFYMTLDCIRKSGVEIEEVKALHFKIKGNQSYQYDYFPIENDASAKAVIKVANALGHDIAWAKTTTTYQRDAVIDDFLLQIKAGNCTIDVKDCPDIVPVLALAMALSPYTYEIVGASRLIDKESNRLEAVYNGLNALGANIQMTLDGLVIKGVKELRGGCVDSYHDHRIAMMATIAASVCQGDVIIKNGDCVAKSWPQFYEDIKALGGAVDEL